MLSHRVSGSRIKNTITINTKKTKSNKHKLLIDGGMTLWRRELRTEKGKIQGIWCVWIPLILMKPKNYY